MMKLEKKKERLLKSL